MSLILDGTNGLSDIDGSAATPAIRGTDANTGIFFPAADTIAFSEGGVEAMRLDSAGNVGIGITPTYRLDVAQTGATTIASSFAMARITGANATANDLALIGPNTSQVRINFGDTDSGNIGEIGYNHSTNSMRFVTNNSEAIRIDSAGDVGIGNTNPLSYLDVGDAASTSTMDSNGSGQFRIRGGSQALAFAIESANLATIYTNSSSGALAFGTNETERMRIDSSGNLLVGKTSTNTADLGCALTDGDGDVAGYFVCENASGILLLNRPTSDGTLISFRQAGTQEGTISVSGTTVSYNGGHLSRWAQTTTAKDDTLVKGTVLSNLDEMNVYTDAEGNPVANEQLNKVKVSDTEGDANVAGVFVNWTHDEQHNVDEINMAMTGDMIIRIAQGVTVVRGDLLMSAGDGTAKPQGDDIVRSKTVAKVTSNHVTCTYADGSYCVPCVLMAC